MKFISTPIEGLWLIEPMIHHDDRGSFFESYNAAVFKDHGLPTDFVQDNQSRSKKGVIRGLHFQHPPYAQSKLVRVIRGSVLDVAVDMRKGSATFGQHYSVSLSGQNGMMLFVPEGFAHGFVALEEDTIFHYKVGNYYHKAAEGGIRYNDADLGIDWKVTNPVASQKDLVLPFWKEFIKQL